MKFTKQHRSYLVGAQFIGAPPIYRPMARRCAPQADKSAMCTINDSVGKIGRDQLDQATSKGKRCAKQAEQAKELKGQHDVVEKPTRCACITRKSLLCNMCCCLFLPV